MNIAVTSDQMRKMDQKAIESFGIPGVILMENAGRAIADLIRQNFDLYTHILIFCGKGNNGGDGFVVARYLSNADYPVTIYLAADKSDLKGDALLNYKIVEKLDIPILFIKSVDDLPEIYEDEVIVDGLLGTGISGDVKGLYSDVIDWINESGLPVVSVDCPSGLNCDKGSVGSVCIQADFTVTMGEIKQGLLLPPGSQYVGELSVADIGFPAILSSSESYNTYILDRESIASLLPERPQQGHKGDFGKVFLLAGSKGLTGAAALASLASLRSGAGLSVLGIPESLNHILEDKLTEVMTKPLPDTEDGSLSLNAQNEINDFLSWADVLAIGPGLSLHPETSELVRALIPNLKHPTVLDADGINAFQGHVDILKSGSFSGVLTPHPGELSGIINHSIEAILENRIDIVRETSQKFGCVLVLKGAPTIIGTPEGNIYINTTGNSGMGTAGSGDVLTGMIAGLLAQGLPVNDAALCGVYVHGLAGDIAAEVVGERSMIASDLIDSLGAAFLSLEEVV